MMSHDTKSALRKRRKEARRAALEAIANMADPDLRNICHELGREINQRTNDMNELRSRLDAVRSEMERRTTLTSVGIHISDHAVVRYLERYKGMDMKSVREEIAVMARRAGRPGSGDQYARRRDEESGLTLGMNEISNAVTTVFCEDEQVVMKT